MDVPGLTFMDLDCEEYPCIATFEIFDDEWPLGTNLSYMYDLNEVIAHVGYPLEKGPGWIQRRDGLWNHVITVSLPDRDLSADEWFHVEQRVQDVTIRYEGP